MASATVKESGLSVQGQLHPNARLANTLQLTSHMDRQLREVAAGAFGGPLIVGFLTPQRNAMTLAAKDITSSYLGLYRSVFKDGFWMGWRGGFGPALSASLQFTAIGPVYLHAEREFKSPCAGVVISSFTESLFTYSAQRRNAQIQYNATQRPRDHLSHQPAHQLVGPGFTCHVLRNISAVIGIRLISPYTHQVVQRVPGSSLLSEEGSLVASDLVSSIAGATLSMPFNHIFSWCACTPELMKMSLAEKAKAQGTFIVKSYVDHGFRLLVRDLAVRISNAALLYTFYRVIERRCVG